MSTGSSAEKGKQSPQYKCVLKNCNRLTGHLRINKENKRNLFCEFIVEGWCDPGDCPSENDIISIALKKIEDDPTNYGVFIAMLEQIAGMDNIVKNLKGTLYNCISIKCSLCICLV